MTRKRSLEIAKSKLADFFQNQDSKLFSPSQVRQILDFNRESWGLSKSVTFSKFSAFLIEEVGLLFETCAFPSRTYSRYAVGHIPLYEFLLSLIPDSYFSHFTALDLHNLTEKNPDRIYLNFPQERKLKKSSSLDQSLIDRAFHGSMRVSQNEALFRENQVMLLNSMGHKDLGITVAKGPEGADLRISDMERTLIDIAVRPAYSGGVSNILSAYKKARGNVSIRKLVKILKALDFAYPYHQSIGFYIERSGYKNSEVALLREFSKKYDFYLDYKMTETNYSRDWRLYYPTDLK
jgi:hypothetical protein